MSDIERDPMAVREYERTLTEVAERQVVDEAEDAISRAWIAELDAVRHEGLRLAMTLRVAERIAREKLRTAQIVGRPDELAHAHARFAVTKAEASQRLGHANALLASVDVELDAVCRAGLERSRRNERDMERLRTAWTAAYGQAGE
ncbi:hypothetical protein [Actinospica sp.]|jgi:hypothetical protein|uniref:hypothetical protein n=1 Tax=Actinospica sp. TaxID=1872142 RepID=UPI002B727278|nr:hypothetical protein [Actinospica sp.]HWG28879.1 hypothetical protein [Actinospica sp.]